MRKQSVSICGVSLPLPYYPTVGPLCVHQSTLSSGPVNENCDMTFQDYFNTLDLTCDGARITDAGVLVWTPDENTPDIVYYQVGAL